MPRKKPKILFNVFPLMVALAAILMTVLLLANFLKNNAYFNVRGIICSDQDKLASIEKLINVKNKNVFALNLKEISGAIQKRYPGIFEISVTRSLPDKLRITFRERIPFARLDFLSRDFFIDNEAVTINLPENFDPSMLPVINGSALTFRDLKIGQRLKSKNLNIALSILKYISGYEQLKRFKVSRLDTSNLNKISIVLINNILVMVREEDFKDKLKILNSLFDQLGQEINNINYIDLRFNDPIINYKKK